MATLTFTVSGTGYDAELDADAGSRSFPADVSERHVPGGSATYVDLGGAKLEHRAYPLWFPTDVAFTSLAAQRGKSGSLATTVDGTNTAVLLSLQRRKRWPGGETEADAEFLITA